MFFLWIIISYLRLVLELWSGLGLFSDYLGFGASVNNDNVININVFVGFDKIHIKFTDLQIIDHR